jgi:hypothetical protein
MTKTYTVVANTTPAAAYAYVADLQRHPEWSPDDMQIAPETPGPVEVGRTYKAEGKLVGRPNPSTVEVTAMEEPRRFAFKATDANSEWLHEFTFTPSNGGTRIDRQVTVLRAPAIFPIVFTLLHPFVIGPGNMRSMGMLKQCLEARAAAPAGAPAQ